MSVMHIMHMSIKRDKGEGGSKISKKKCYVKIFEWPPRKKGIDETELTSSEPARGSLLKLFSSKKKKKKKIFFRI